MVRRLAVIPARGGSKRISRKNIRDFCGKPMIAHILETARDSGLFDVIHVSTEDREIHDVAAAAGFTPDFTRPADLAQDATPIMPVLKHVADTYANRGCSFDQVWLLMACAPLIEASDLQDAAKLLDGQRGMLAVLAVTTYGAPIEWAFDRQADGLLVPVQPSSFAISSQNLSPKYHDTGSFAGFPSNRVRESSGAGSDEGFIGYPLARTKGIDIDSEEDWALAEAVFRARHNADHSKAT
jgi:N-acylneuraminate cytidylyltransferase